MKHSAVTDETPSAVRMLERVVMRRTDDLTPYAANARTHSPEQVAQIARSIQELGFVNPVLVDSDGGIIAGHGRVLAALSLDMPEVPTLEVHWLTPAQRRAYVIADNQIALNAGWDYAILIDELQAINASSLDVSVLGFSDKELAALMVEVDDEVRPSSSKEIKPEGFALAHQCPRCGFEFNTNKKGGGE